ncbi:P-type conjugative transfer protein VirB9 [Candidatus Orientia mediorientalis]|uniref:P-type conjugative transfer protein VirB9 n=1 Tax=Candidatus Orientia mediorientalis TaxID=911112 RepID=UPI00351D8A28
MRFFFILLLTIILPLKVVAIREPKPTAIDSRIRVITYSPNDVFKFTGYYNYQGCIELDKGEEVINLSMGDPNAWFIQEFGNRIFIKPIKDDATTNMLLITNKRTYFFELHAEEVQNITDSNMIFYVKFLYPDNEKSNNINSASLTSEPDLAHPENYNFYYTISGHQEIAPIKIFDDGDFTYIYFRDKNAAMPTVYVIDDRRKESLANFRISTKHPNLMIIEQVAPRLSLKLGKKVVYVFNEVLLQK